jgi:alkylated DNA repair dioxygenase AlkB
VIEDIALPGASIAFDKDAFVNLDVTALQSEIPWENHRIRMFGRWVDSPRLSCWMGDPQARYRYSGALFEPRPWITTIVEIRERVSAICDVSFNSVLCNLYRDGSDHMGWHRDNEPELGLQPVIASMSLGATRKFMFKRDEPGAKSLSIELTHGSLLVMKGDTQKNYKHALAKTAKPVGPRINLTFRLIV